ncbi:MAG: FecR family protein, partial [Verrucomicrobiae bacterium]|nr:FecR family protein [Verrucomicrobiae bacterium]
MTTRNRQTVTRTAAHFRPGRVLRWTAFPILALAAWFAATAHAKPLGQATVTQINNDVRYKPGAGSERPARRQDVVRGADTLRTGQKSQAELEFEDRTITRLGSNSIFTFDPQKREFELKKGLILFDMPPNAGGGKIVTPAGTAAIEGTAGIISYRSAPKIICLAGKIQVFNPNGKLVATVLPGQLFIMGVTKYPVDFLLSGIKTGKLWGKGLPNNQDEFEKSSNDQLNKLKNGQLELTPFTMIGEGLDVFVATADGQQFNQGIEQKTQGSSLNPGPTPQPPTPTPTFTLTSDDKIEVKVTEPTYAQIVSISTGQIRKTGSVDASGKATFDFGSQSVQVQGPGGPDVVMNPANATVNMDFKTTGNLAFLNAGGTGGGSDHSTELLRFQGGAIQFINSQFHPGMANSPYGPSLLSFNSGSSLLVDPSTLTVESGRIGEYLNVAGRLELFGNTAVSVLNSTLSTPGEWTGLDSGIYIAGSTVDLYGSSLDPGPTGVALIRTLTGNVVRPPASGAYYVYKLSDPWPFRLTHTDIFDINTGGTPYARIVNQITGETRLEGSFEAGGTVKFNFGSQNILATTYGPETVLTPAGALLAMNFETTGNFAFVNMGHGEGGGGTDIPTQRLGFTASNIGFINSKLDPGHDSSPAGPSSLFFSASGNIFVDPSQLYVASGFEDGKDVGGVIDLASQGQFTFAGTTEQKTSAIARGPDAGGEITLMSAGNRVQISQALIDASSTNPGNSSAQGGGVTIMGATQVTVQDSTEVLARGFQGGSIQVSAFSPNANLLAQSSVFDASSNSSDPNAAGAIGGSVSLISMGILGFSGETGNPYAQAYARGLEGGGVSLASYGERFLSGASGPVPVDGVFIHDAVLDASTTGTDPYNPNAKGGSVTIGGQLQVVIQDNTFIAADGPSGYGMGYGQHAGAVDIRSMGSSDLPGRVVVTASDAGNVKIGAVDFVPYGMGGGGPANGNIRVSGADRGHESYTVNLSSSSETGGGAVVLNAANSIGVMHASLTADAFGASSMTPGIVHVQAPEVMFNGANLSASTEAGAGPAGRINVFGLNPNGSFDETSVEIYNSHFLTTGNSKNADSGIFIKGRQVDIAGFNPDTFNPGPARVVIETFNAGSTLGGQINIWDPFNLQFSRPIDAITGSLNLTCDPAAASPQITFVPQTPDPNWTSFARFSATATAPSFLPSGMNLELLGVRDVSNVRTIKVVAQGNMGGGQITANVPDTIKMVSAKLDVSNGGGYAAGNMDLTASNVLLSDTDFDASSMSEVPGPGGQINVTGRNSVQLTSSTTTMTADGSTAGTVRLVSGSETQAGEVKIEALNSAGFIKLKAEDAAHILASLPHSGGFVDIVGAERGENPPTVQIRAGQTSTGAGGNIMIKAVEAIRLANVGIRADAGPGGGAGRSRGSGNGRSSRRPGSNAAAISSVVAPGPTISASTSWGTGKGARSLIAARNPSASSRRACSIASRPVSMISGLTGASAG